MNDDEPADSDGDRITEVEELFADLDGVLPAEMTPLFYEHSYWELMLAVRDLLDILHRGAGK
ncbi:hypothetical protein CSW53_27370 (plasmid) [Rhodococcus ruber]|nr:hypothetical protein CSW53_27370 [Rhodococcus ruber]